MFTCETICLPNHYLNFKKNLLFLSAFNDFHPKGSKAAGILWKQGLGNCLDVDSQYILLTWLLKSLSFGLAD